MAVISSIPGLEVTIKVNGVTAKEYDIPDGGDCTPMARKDFDLPKAYDRALPYIVKYIEAKPGEPYRFDVTKQAGFRRGSHHIAFQISQDGCQLKLRHEPVDRRSLQKQAWYAGPNSIWSGNETAGYKLHKFQFAAFDIIDTGPFSSEILERQKSVARQCGTLKVEFFRMRKSKLQNAPSHSTFPGGPMKELVEKALKGQTVDCFTTYDTMPIDSPPCLEVPVDDYNDSERRPFAVFEFRYRTREGLMREGIIPRPTIAERVEGMGEGEVRQRLAQMMEENERSASAIGNGERVSLDTKDHRGVKREADEMPDVEFMTRYKARRLENGCMEVDLTAD